MKQLLPFLLLLLISITGNPVLAISQDNELPKCVVVTHCVRNNWEVSNVEEAFKKAKSLIEKTPRTRIIEQSDSYIHAEAMTRWMHYVDDLELIALPKQKILQIRSESRIGIGDNGVNKKRVDNLAYLMSTNK